MPDSHVFSFYLDDDQDDDAPQEMRPELAQKFDALPGSVLKNTPFARALGPNDNARTRIDVCMRALAHNGFSLAEIIELSRSYPAGAGLNSLGQQTPALIAELWRERELEEAKAEEAKRQSGSIRVLTIDDLAVQAPRGYLVKGWLSPGEISLIVGAKNARKTFLALYVAYAIAQADRSSAGA